MPHWCGRGGGGPRIDPGEHCRRIPLRDDDVQVPTVGAASGASGHRSACGPRHARCRGGLTGAALREPPGVADEPEGAEQGPADTKDQQEDQQDVRPAAATGARVCSHGMADALWDRQRRLDRNRNRNP